MIKKLLIALTLPILFQISAQAVSGDISVEGTFHSQGLTIINTCEVQSSVRVGNAGASIEGSTGKIYGDASSLRNIPIPTPATSIGVALDGGGGSPIAADTLAYIYVPYACTINNWTLLADVPGSIVIDIWKADYSNYPPTDANSITNGHEPTISSGINAQDTDLSDWTSVEVSVGDVIAFHVDSASTVSRATLVMGVTKK